MSVTHCSESHERFYELQSAGGSEDEKEEEEGGKSFERSIVRKTKVTNKRKFTPSQVVGELDESGNGRSTGPINGSCQ